LDSPLYRYLDLLPSLIDKQGGQRWRLNQKVKNQK